MQSQVFYSVAQTRAIERAVFARADAASYALMQRAGAATWRRLRAQWPQAQRLAVVCGRGNNGGDGYVLALLARQAGLDVSVYALGVPRTGSDAERACADFRASGAEVLAAPSVVALRGADVIVDALLGIGLTRAPDAETATAIDAINESGLPVLAIDVPSGLDADTGHAPGACVRAALTVTFLVPKRGLVTGVAVDHVGVCVLETLDVEPGAALECGPGVRAIDSYWVARALPPRAASAHKGRFGYVLAMGGNHGFGGAVQLCAQAALRSGAGLVGVATRAEHVAALLGACPEAMTLAVACADDLSPMLARATVLAVGPGLGRDAWALELLNAALRAELPLVLDADALNLLAERQFALPTDTVLTPHPGEAARLLGSDTATVQADRYAAALRLAQRYGAVVVLKGAGTVVAAPDGELAVCDVANPGMASGGMGDVLTGVIAALRAQQLPPFEAAAIGVGAHAFAARVAVRAGARGMLARDVIANLRSQVNP
jgi:NAD(P)H-hydrate epimerase